MNFVRNLDINTASEIYASEINGRIIKTIIYLSCSDTENRTLHKGIYTVRVINDSKVYTRKLILY
jgi:hypothetical protein